MDFKAIGLLTLVVGCAGPGEAIDVISTSPASVALEYTHSYSFELGETVKAAEAAAAAAAAVSAPPCRPARRWSRC